jgi:hypothetical protein
MPRAAKEVDKEADELLDKLHDALKTSPTQRRQFATALNNYSAQEQRYIRQLLLSKKLTTTGAQSLRF